MLKLMQGGCLELMKDIPDGSVDFVLTDPPYGTTACKWDSVIPFEPMWAQLRRVVKDNGAIVFTSSQPFTTSLISSNMGMFKYDFCWNKGSTTGFLNAKKMPLRKHEEILVFSKAKIGAFTYNPQMTKGLLQKKGGYHKKKTDVYGDYKRVPKINDVYYPTSIIDCGVVYRNANQHPTQKPVALLEYLIRTYTNEGETVLDFTMGSGSTGVACVNTNRNFIGIELDADYFKIAEKRIADAQNKPEQISLIANK